jgi:predicted nucleotidyltransferase
MKLLTNNKSQILRLFLTNPTKSFYMHEIGRILNKKPGIFQRSLNNLVEQGMLNSQYSANVRYFSVNRNYPLLPEIKNIVFKTVGIQGLLIEEFKKIHGIKFAFIYGSYAKGKENALSDVDVVVIGSLDEDKLIKSLDKLELVLKREINYKLYPLKNFKDQIAKKEPFIIHILKEKKIMLVGEEIGLRKIFER